MKITTTIWPAGPWTSGMSWWNLTQNYHPPSIFSSNLCDLEKRPWRRSEIRNSVIIRKSFIHEHMKDWSWHFNYMISRFENKEESWNCEIMKFWKEIAKSRMNEIEKLRNFEVKLWNHEVVKFWREFCQQNFTISRFRDFTPKLYDFVISQFRDFIISFKNFFLSTCLHCNHPFSKWRNFLKPVII